jgi:hypothetical protein
MLKLSRAAHADDVELMAWHAILHAETLAAVIVTDRRDSNTRLLDQKRAAAQGNYAVMIWLDHASADVKQSAYPALASDLSAILSAVRGRLVYTHNPVDFSHTSCFA